MQEYARIEGDSVDVRPRRNVGQNLCLPAAEARVGETLVARGTRLGYAELAVGRAGGRVPKLAVTPRPRVAILSTGDEIVGVNRNARPVSRFATATAFRSRRRWRWPAATPSVLGNAPDEVGELRARIEQGLESDMLVLSGGVSVGKYDLGRAGAARTRR